MSAYCEAAQGHPFHGPYHDREYGFPIADDWELFERLTLEIFQAGLSWLIVLKKRPGFRIAFENFDVDRIAAFDDGDRQRLCQDASIIRNKRKIDAVIENAKTVIKMRESHGSFANWIQSNHPLSKDEWVKLFRQNFKFTGGEIVNEFLMSSGYLPGAHHENCPVYGKIIQLHPAWLTN